MKPSRSLLRDLKSGFRDSTTVRIVGSLIDQGASSFGSFLVLVICGREMNPAEFGLLSTAMAGVALAAIIHACIVTDPIMLFGSKIGNAGWVRYNKSIVGFNVAFVAVVAAFVMVFLSIIKVTSVSSWAILAGVIGGVAANTGRRVNLAMYRPFKSATISTANASLTSIGLLGYHVIVGLTANAVLVIIGLGGVSASLLVNQSDALPITGDSIGSFRKDISKHFDYGKWALLIAMVSWVSGNIQYMLIPTMLGVEANGVYRLANTLLLPYQTASVALTGLILVSLSRADQIERRAFIIRVNLATLIGTIFYSLIVYILSEPILTALFGGASPDLLKSHYYLILIVPLVSCWTDLVSVVMRVEGKLQQMFIGNMVAGMFGICGAAALIFAFGLTGAYFSAIFVSAVRSLFLWTLRNRTVEPT